MENQNLLFAKACQLYSEPRLRGYLKRVERHDELDALAAYNWNIQLSESLYPALQALEVALRNALHQSLALEYRSENWFDASFLHRKEQAVIAEIKQTLKRKHKAIACDRIVAELHFGFWTSLFDVRYEHHQILWPHLLPSVFPHIPKKFRTRHYLSKQLNHIRKLRNRIFHYAPIWYWNDLAQHHKNLLSLLQWLSPIAYQHIILLDRFPRVYQQGFEKNRHLLTNDFSQEKSSLTEEIA